MALLLVFSFATLGSGEYLREFARKPYAINGYIYANDIRVAEATRIANSGGMLANAKWLKPNLSPVEYGHQVFAMQCGNCHSVAGYRSMTKRVRGWDATFATAAVPSLTLMRGTMPAFAGDARDAAALGGFLATLAPATVQVHAGQETAAGREVFAMHCAMCHSVGGKFRPLGIAGGDADSIVTMVKMLPDIEPRMPPFTGTEAEGHALALWLSAQK